MDPLEQKAIALREALLALPESVERTIALRAARHSISLMSRDMISASDAYYRARRFYEQATQNTERKSA